jgi:hypothetical protein
VLIQGSVDCDAQYSVSSLVQIILDPYYRTIEGEKENTKYTIVIKNLKYFRICCIDRKGMGEYGISFLFSIGSLEKNTPRKCKIIFFLTILLLQSRFPLRLSNFWMQCGSFGDNIQGNLNFLKNFSKSWYPSPGVVLRPISLPTLKRNYD